MIIPYFNIHFLLQNLLNVGLLKLLLKLITFDVYVIALPGEVRSMFRSMFVYINVYVH